MFHHWRASFAFEYHNVSSSLGIMSCTHCQESPCIMTDFGDEAIRMVCQESENRGMQ
jgi:hypothetical protein